MAAVAHLAQQLLQQLHLLPPNKQQQGQQHLH
jgi:hypothetical protein